MNNTGQKWTKSEFIPKCVLGEGSFAPVWKVYHQSVGQEFAIKQVQVDKTIRYFKGETSKLFREVEILLKISHPNVLRYYYCWYEGKNVINDKLQENYKPPDVEYSETIPETNFLFIQMELCDSTLRDWIKNYPYSSTEIKEERLSEIPNIFLQISDGLEYLHSENIIHRDLKPDNILYKMDGEKKIWKIGDFGLSIQQLDSLEVETYPAGARKYRSPENINTKKSDVYTLGLIFLQVLNNNLDKDDPKIVEHAKPKIEPEFFSYLEIISLMLKSDPGQRPSSKDVWESFKNPGTPNTKNNHKFYSSADRLSSLGNSVHNAQFGVKARVFNFVGRKQELKELNEMFMEKKACVVLISAMGGKGKTELCRSFIQQLPKNVSTLVTWVSGDGPQQFQQSLSEISQEMNVSTTDSKGKPLSVEKIIKNISIKKKSKWVAIIDNVDEEFSDFYSAIDTLQRNEAFVVVTSKKSDIQTEKHIFLEDLKDEDAWEFVRLSLDNIPSQKMIIDLCKFLQNYALALQQAVAFIKYKQSVEDESYGIAEYLQELNSDNTNAFDHKIASTGYGDTLLKVFELTLSKIQPRTSFFERLKNMFNKNKKESPELILHILSLLQPDGIQKEFLKKLFSFFESEESFDSSISTLKSVSLIGVNKGEVSIHRIVQKLTRDKMKTENKFNLVIEKILANIDADKSTKQETVQVIQIWNHALSKSEIINKVSNFAVKISQRLLDLSLYREMKNFSEITLQQFVTVLEPYNSDTQIMQHQLGVALEKNGEYEDALIKFQVLWEKSKEVLGEEHEETLIFASDIATVLHNLERFNDELEWHGKVLKSQEQIHGETHQFTKSNMATLLYQQCKREDEALTIYKQVLEWSKKKFGPEDPHTLATKNNIACCLYKQDKFGDAKKEFEEVLELREKVLCEDHADTLSTKALLSATLHSLGQKEEGIEMMGQVLISQEEVLGPNHPHTNITRDTITLWRTRLYD